MILKKKHQLAGAAILINAGALCTALPAAALERQYGELSLSVNTTLSYGVTVSVQQTDCTNVNPANGGCNFGKRLPTFGVPIAGGGVDAFGRAIPAGGLRTGTRSLNTDDGARNFDSGDIVNATAKATVDFEARWRNYTLFIRGLAFYDSVYDRNNLDGRDLNGAGQDDLASDVRLLDAFLAANFEIGDVPLTVRVGNQVINWGESLLIRGGINSYVPVDVARLRAPGSEVKEGLLPSASVYVSAGVLPNVDIQGFYQWEHVETEVDPARSFYSTFDGAGAGGRFLLLGGADDVATSPIFLPRFRDQGQEGGSWGVGATYYAEWLNQGTELQAYYVNFSSTLPYLTFKAPPVNLEATCDALGVAGVVPDGFDGGPDSCVFDPLTHGPTAFAVSTNQTEFGFQFPDDIGIFGLAFNTQAFDTALSGEIAFWPDMPMAITDGEVLAQIIDSDDSSIPAGEVLRAPLILGAYATYGGLSALGAGAAAVAATAGTPYAVAAPTGGPGDIFDGFIEEDAITGQVSAIRSFSQSHVISDIFKADQTIAILNAGFMWVPDLPDTDEAVVRAPGCELGHPNLATSLALASGSSANTNIECASKFSTGVRAVVQTTYNNVANTPVSLSPRLAIQKDISGRSPGPYGPGFVAGQGSISIGLTADLQERWRANVEYLNFFGAGERNQLNDRDTISFNVSFTF